MEARRELTTYIHFGFFPYIEIVRSNQPTDCPGSYKEYRSLAPFVRQVKAFFHYRKGLEYKKKNYFEVQNWTQPPLVTGKKTAKI